MIGFLDHIYKREIILSHTSTHSHETKRLWRGLTWMSLCVAILVQSTGCGRNECEALQRSYRRTLKQEMALGQAPLRESPVLMSAQLHETLLNEVIQQTLPEQGKISASKSLPAQSKLKTKTTLKNLRVRVSETCDRCLEIRGTVLFDVTVTTAGLTIFKGKTTGKLAGELPLDLTQSARGTSLVADLRRAKIKSVSVKIKDLPSWGRKPLNEAATSTTRKLLKKFGEKVTLATWQSISLPDTTIKLDAKRLHMMPDADSIWVGFSSNIPTREASLQPRNSLRRGEKAAVGFSGAALTGAIRELLKNGEIPARYNEKLKPDAKGVHRVTLKSVDPSVEGLGLQFSIWRLPEKGTCYSADIAGKATLRLGQSKKGKPEVKIKLSDLDVESTQGDDTLLKLGLWWNSVFVGEVFEAQTKVLAARTLEMGPLGKRKLEVQRISSTEDAVYVVTSLDGVVQRGKKKKRAK